MIINIKKAITILSLVTIPINFVYAEAIDLKSIDNVKLKTGYDIVNEGGHKIVTIYNDEGDLYDNVFSNIVVQSAKNQDIPVISKKEDMEEILAKVMPNYDKISYTEADLMRFSSDDLALAFATLLNKYKNNLKMTNETTPSVIYTTDFTLLNIKMLQYILSDDYKFDSALAEKYKYTEKLSQSVNEYIEDKLIEKRKNIATESDMFVEKEYADVRDFGDIKILNNGITAVRLGKLIDNLYYPLTICVDRPIHIKKDIIDKLSVGDEIRLYFCAREKMRKDNYETYTYVGDFIRKEPRKASDNSGFSEGYKLFGDGLEDKRFLKLNHNGEQYVYLEYNEDGTDNYIFSSGNYKMSHKVDYELRVLKNARICGCCNYYAELPFIILGYNVDEHIFDDNSKMITTHKNIYEDIKDIFGYTNEESDESYAQDLNYICMDDKGYVTAIYYGYYEY